MIQLVSGGCNSRINWCSTPVLGHRQVRWLAMMAMLRAIATSISARSTILSVDVHWDRVWETDVAPTVGIGYPRAVFA